MKYAILLLSFLLSGCALFMSSGKKKMYHRLANDTKTTASGYLAIPVKIPRSSTKKVLVIQTEALRQIAFAEEYSNKVYSKYMYRLLINKRTLKLTEQQYKALLDRNYGDYFIAPKECRFSDHEFDSIINRHFQPYIEKKYLSGRIQIEN